jgi:hypothetical protein
MCLVEPVVLLTRFCRAARVTWRPLVAGDTIHQREQGAQGAAVDDWVAVEAKEANSIGLRPERYDLSFVFLYYQCYY